MTSRIEADYLVVGAGAMGMAFTLRAFARSSRCARTAPTLPAQLVAMVANGFKGPSPRCSKPRGGGSWPRVPVDDARGILALLSRTHWAPWSHQPLLDRGPHEQRRWWRAFVVVTGGVRSGRTCTSRPWSVSVVGGRWAVVPAGHHGRMTTYSSEELEVIQGFVDRVSSYQDGHRKAPSSRNLTRGWLKPDWVEDGDVARLTAAIEDEPGSIGATSRLGHPRNQSLRSHLDDRTV